jgi:hypothetical protein
MLTLKQITVARVGIEGRAIFDQSINGHAVFKGRFPQINRFGI